MELRFLDGAHAPPVEKKPMFHRAGVAIIWQPLSAEAFAHRCPRIDARRDDAANFPLTEQ
jgi:hypothetical protein